MLLKNDFKMHEGALRRFFSPQESSTLLQSWDLQPARVKAIQTPALDAIAKNVGRGTYPASSAPETQDAYTDKVKSKSGLLNRKRAELRAHDRAVDQLSEGWYKPVKTCNDPGSDIYEALNGINPAPTTPAPETIETSLQWHRVPSSSWNRWCELRLTKPKICHSTAN